MTSSLRTLFFDAGGVLVRPNWSRVAGYFANHGKVVDAGRLANAEQIAAHELDTPEHFLGSDDASRWTRFVTTVFLRAGLDVDAAVLAPVLRDMHAYHASQNLWEVIPPGVPEALDRFRAAGFQLVVVSNANGTVRGKLARLGLASRFHHILDSFEEKVEKPDPRFFEIALRRSGADRATTIHIGDVYHVDIVGARAAGLQAVLLDSAGLHAGRDCDRVASLGEFADRLCGPLSPS
ncbi:MAG TPA: HAD family hydrolase [Planctomycetota bacterium]|nr:HAD family hydrolase [Planctomycetota bacterium]